MKLQNENELNNTRRKLDELERHRAELLKAQQAEHNYVRELTLRSFNRLIKQLKEEIAVYEAHAKEAAQAAHSP